jgi:hypothetical protein
MLDGHRPYLSFPGINESTVTGLEFLHFLIGIIESLGYSDTGNRGIEITVYDRHRYSGFSHRFHMFLSDKQSDKKQEWCTGKDDKSQCEVDTGKVEEREDQ